MKRLKGLWRLSSAYERAYEKLLRDVGPCGVDQKLTAFWPQLAPDYEPGVGWLFIGQAVNGWGPKIGAKFPARDRWSAAEVREYSEETEAVGGSPLDWVVESKSRIAPFWNAVRWLNSEDDAGWRTGWHGAMAWSNLAKVAPVAGGNPDAELVAAQLDACRDLLRLEITEIKPAVVVVLAGATWFRPLLPSDVQTQVDAEVLDPRRDIAIVNLNGTPTVLGPHPGTASRAGLGAEALGKLICRRLKAAGHPT